jgi:hypothetical protein
VTVERSKQYMGRHMRQAPVVHVEVGSIVGGTCMMCGEYDENATESGDGLVCGNCVDGENDANVELSAEKLAAEKRKKR